MSELRSDMNRRFDDVNRHVEDKYQLLDQKMDSGFQMINQKLDHLIEISANHESRIFKLEHPQ